MIKVLVLGSSTLFIVSLGGIAFFLIGDQSTNLDPTDADYLWRSNQVLIDNEAAIGRASLAVGLLSAFTLALLYSRDRIKGHTLAQVGVLSAFAVWLGALYRVVTAGVRSKYWWRNDVARHPSSSYCDHRPRVHYPNTICHKAVAIAQLAIRSNIGALTNKSPALPVRSATTT